MKDISWKETKSGYPHIYRNLDKIDWGVTNCDSARDPVYEYPIFWKGSKMEWQPNVDKKSQSKTPIRVVYAAKNGALRYCGIMTHSEVAVDHQGLGYFQKCE